MPGKITGNLEGNKRLPENLEPSKTALLIIDMMNRFCDPAWLGRNGTPEQVEWYRRELDEIIPRLEKVLRHFRRIGGLVVHVVNAKWTVDGREVVPYQRGRDYDLFDTTAMSSFPTLGSIQEEIIVRKVASSAFQATGLDFLLRNAGIENVLISGQFGDACCFYSLIMSREAGFTNYWLHDSILFSDQPAKELFNPLINRRWAAFISAGDIESVLRQNSA